MSWIVSPPKIHMYTSEWNRIWIQGLCRGDYGKMRLFWALNQYDHNRIWVHNPTWKEKIRTYTYTRAHSYRGKTMWRHSKKAAYKERWRPLKKPNLWTPLFWTSGFQIMRNKFLLCKPPSLWFVTAAPANKYRCPPKYNEIRKL